MENSNILKGGRVGIFRPCNVKLLIAAIPKVDYKDKFETLLYTGCRYSELQWLYKHQDAFDGEKIHIPSFKPKAKHGDRFVTLNSNGKRAVTYFLRSKKNFPAINGWNFNLKRWCKLANIDKNGISAKSTRKTWESWLVTMYPMASLQILHSMGHTDKVALDYYMMLPFNDQDKQDMKFYTDGWI